MKPTPNYFPIERGVYEVTAGLRPLGFDFGYAELDRNVFQICSDFAEFRKNKIECRKERLSKYFVTLDLSEKHKSYTTEFIVKRLLHEYPLIFKLENHVLHCSHSHDKISFNSDWSLKKIESVEDIGPAVTESLDALSLQVQEDLVLMCRNQVKKDYLGMIHLCSPSHWAAEDKIGNSFFRTHQPIPGIDKINRIADNMVEAMINKGPFVRFVWSFVTDKRLNHHTVAPSSWDPAKWKGRSFDLSQAIPFFFRVERQVVFGLPEIEASLFTIRISFIDGTEIKSNENYRTQLLGALNSMTPESRVYKGVANCFTELTDWLQS